MKKVIILLIILLSGLGYSYSETLSFSLTNRDINLTTEKEGVRVIQTDSYYSGDRTEPSIPILAHYFEIPELTKIESVTIQPNNLKNIVLDKPLLLQPEQVIISNTDNVNTEPQFYEDARFPKTWLYNHGSSIAGSKNIGFIAVYACGYDKQNNSLEVPYDFTVNVNLVSAPKAKKMQDSRITREIHQQLNLATKLEVEEETYLLIYPQVYETAYQTLISLRQTQGLNVLTETTETIFAEYTGVDNAEKIRNFIIDKYDNGGVDYVTLGGDVEHIPERRLWAFDCNYGIDDENNIPGDIYYANLNGDWNANENNLYGEDDDDVDLFPEVIVSRLPAIYGANEVEAMVNKHIAYESGQQQDYSQGLGLSQNLWEDSNSVYAQEYIEEMYYPNFINNVILNEAENNVANAQANFNRNPTIIQHTGHCFWNVISLGDGRINNSFLSNMSNDYAGVMYSIGCWASALEYDSIADKLVRLPQHGITAFVGNSRYGWGAPSADGFGFSEFFQKEFSKLIFTEDITNVAMANQLQKLPFVAYQNGDSVYKWCSYQLNTLGDSYYHLFTSEPKNLIVDYDVIGNNYSLFITDGQEPVEDVVVTVNEDLHLFSDHNGIVTFIDDGLPYVSFYKEGYKIIDQVLTNNFESCITEYQLPGIVTPNSERVIDFKIKNGLDIDLSWELRVKEGETILGETSGTTIAGLVTDWIEVSFAQPEANILSLELYSNTSNEVLDTKYVNVNLAKPEIEITDFNVSPYPVEYNGYNYFSYIIKNISNYALDISNIEYNSDDLEIGIVLPMRVNLEPGEEYTLSNDFALLEDVNIASMNINMTLTNEYWEDQAQEFNYYFSVGQQSLSENFETQPTWFQESAWQRTDFYAYDGDYSLTCSPETYGVYDLDLPLLTYTDDITLSFMYKYKMPMYGKDGFSIFVITDDIEERIIFLGSGGALDNSDRDPNDYIFSDWAEYSLNLGDLLLNKPEIGQEFTLRFSFTYIEDFSVDNNYANVDELGIFLDNMLLSYDEQNVSNEQDVEPLNNHIFLYPNPLRNSPLTIRHNSKIGQEYDISIYNLKGQKIDSYHGSIKSSDKEAIQLPIFQKSREKLSSGIYFVKYKTVDTSELKKILFLK